MAAQKLLVGCTVGLLASQAAGVAFEGAPKFDAGIAGKKAFVKFYAPWCGHCKKMKPYWDQLMADYDGMDGVVVADVDCTADINKYLCGENRFNISGFPTLKYIEDPENEPAGEPYDGAREEDDLRAFAEEKLGPACSAVNLDLCAPRKKAELEKWLSIDKTILETAYGQKKQALEDAESKFKAASATLQATYKDLTDEKEAKIAEATPGLPLMRAVLKKLQASDSAVEEE